MACGSEDTTRLLSSVGIAWAFAMGCLILNGRIFVRSASVTPIPSIRSTTSCGPREWSRDRSSPLATSAPGRAGEDRGGTVGALVLAATMDDWIARIDRHGIE